MEIYFARHGESEGNALGVFCGHMDFNLTEKGQGQANAHGANLHSAKPFDLVLISDLARARSTAELLKHEGKKVIETPLLRERKLGKIEGHGASEFGLPENFHQRYYAEDRPSYRELGVEPLESVLHRARQIIGLIREHKAQKVLIVGHEWMLSYIKSELLGEDEGNRTYKLHPHDEIHKMTVSSEGKAKLTVWSPES